VTETSERFEKCDGTRREGRGRVGGSDARRLSVHFELKRAIFGDSKFEEQLTYSTETRRMATANKTCVSGKN